MNLSYLEGAGKAISTPHFPCLSVSVSTCWCARACGHMLVIWTEVFPTRSPFLSAAVGGLGGAWNLLPGDQDAQQNILEVVN